MVVVKVERDFSEDFLDESKQMKKKVKEGED